jgi:hypothetical protein
VRRHRAARSWRPSPSWRRPRFAVAGPRDAGSSLSEMVVSVGLVAVLSTAMMAAALSTRDVGADARELTMVNEESRLAMERLVRELRQASTLLSLHLPATAAEDTVLTFWTDFNGNGTADFSAADPEVLTYRWQPGAGTLTLTANDTAGTSVTRPVLAANVSAFTVVPRSSLWQYDADHDGLTSWTELDAAGAPVGDADGVLGSTELDHVDSLVLSITVAAGTHRQSYDTQVDLRNRNLS